MKTTRRWLLPFTCAVDLQAIDAAVRVASHSGATLIALALLAPGQRPRREQHRTSCVRLEQIQESKDFLEAVRWKAMRQQVTVECYEMFTEDVAGSIATQVRDLDCQSIMVTRRGLEDGLLSSHDLKQVLVRPPVSLFFLPLSGTKRDTLPTIPFLSSLQRLFRQHVREQVAGVSRVLVLHRWQKKGAEIHACEPYIAGRGRCGPARSGLAQPSGSRT